MSAENHIEIKVSDPCCDVWRLIRSEFDWMTFTDYPQYRCMPYIKIGATMWRVNHCPSCGKEVRNINEFAEAGA